MCTSATGEFSAATQSWRRGVLRLRQRSVAGGDGVVHPARTTDAENNIELVKGLFQDTIDLDEPVAFRTSSRDWYESTMVCLERIALLLVPGGRIVLHDYHAWSGCQTVVDEDFSDPGLPPRAARQGARRQT